MKQRLTFTFALAVSAFLIPGSFSRPADAEQMTEIRIATLAPNGTPWTKVYNAWNRTLQKETNNTLKFKFYTGGSMGDERDYIRKMRAGQLDAASLTTFGLGQIVRPVLVLALPGVIETYEQLDTVRAKLNDHFEEMFAEAGYQLLIWGDVGKARLFSTEKVERPAQLKKLRPWAWKDDLIFTEFFDVIGANPVRLGVPEVYPALQTHMIDTVPASALAALALQWYTRLNFVSAQSMGLIVDASLMRKDKWDALTPEQQTVLLETGKRAHQALVKASRKDDDRAYQTLLKRGLTPVDTEAYQVEWDQAEAALRTKLVGRVYPKSLLDEVIQATRN
ncbi:MAG: TRAP transporter substrate-binding protein DctP [Myxococcota bacterium]